MAGEVTYAQLMQSETITGLFSHIKSPGTFFQRFTKTSPGDPSSARHRGRHIGWDIFNATRTRAQGRAPGSGPGTTSRKPVGHVSAQCYRSFEKTLLLDEEIYMGRPLGGAIGTVDARGQAYVAKQVKFLKQRMVNSREFMVSRLFRGGFGVAIDGESFKLTEFGAGTFDVDMQLPATHKDYLDGLVTESWQNPNADLITFFLNLNAVAVRETGMMITRCIINSVTLGYLFTNVGLAQVGGSAYRIFDQFTVKELQTSNGTRPSGYDVVFRALPQIIFHVTDEVDVPGDTDSITAAGTSKYVPDGKAIFTPDPDSEWVGYIEGSEVVRENVMDNGKEVFGFHAWTTPVIDPPGSELKNLDNGLPALMMPRVIFYATISGF